MKTLLKRTISYLLTFAMLFAMLPAFGSLNAYAVSLVGSFDEVSCPDAGKIRIKGWGADLDNKSASVEIHVYVGGPAGVGEGHSLGFTSIYRPDVNTQVGVTGIHGFDFIFDTQKYNNQDIYVYVISGDISIQLEVKTLYVSPADPAYGDNNWTLSRYDYVSTIPDGVYRIASAANPNYSLDIAAAGEADGTNVQLFANIESDAQLFHLRRIAHTDILTPSGYLEKRTIVSLMNINSQRVLDKDASSNNIHQYGQLADNMYRQWILHDNGDGTYCFESVAQPGYFMTIEGGMIANGANISVSPSNPDGSPNLYQKFNLSTEYVHGDHRIGSAEGFLKTGENRFWRSTAENRNDTFVLDITGASKDQGANAHIWTAMNTYALQQMFDIQKDGEGWYTIRNINSGLFLATNSGAAGKNLDTVQQWNTNSDAAKWAFVPRVRTDGSLSYWIVNKATSLYLLHIFDTDGSAVAVFSLDNSSVVDSDWRSWGMESCLSNADIGTITNGSTGIAADQFDTSDTISLPIKIFDYNDDGLLFEYSLNTGHDNGGFTLTHASDTSAYPNWSIGQITIGNDIFYDVNSFGDTYFVGSNKFWNASPDGLNNIYVVNQEHTNLQYLTKYLNYSVYGEMISGGATMGLVKPTLREVNGHRLMEYNDEVVAYIADLLEWTLAYREKYENGDITLENSPHDIPLGKEISAYGNDTAGLLLQQLKLNNGNQLLNYDTDPADRRSQIYTNLVETYEKKDHLIGTWNECKEYINTYTDAAYFILNNLFYPESYNMPQDKFDYLVLSKAKLANGKSAYVFDSNFSDTYTYTEGITNTAVKYDFDAKTISNTSMLGKPLVRSLLTTVGGPYFTFLPVWDSEGVQSGIDNYYTESFDNKNYNYVLQCNGKFTYTENDGLFFDFEGDDDVYLFINGQLVLDIGGAHAVTVVNMNLNDYVYAARAAVAAGSTDPRDLALALIDGEDYSFDFYYMERHTSGANMRIATNIRVSDPNLDTDKTAYQNGVEVNYGGLVNADENVEYSFKVSNPADSIANLYHLNFSDAKLGVTIDSAHGLNVSGRKALNPAGAALSVSDLKIYFTNQKGETKEYLLNGNTETEKNASLMAYLREVNGHGLLPGCSIEIRGIYYNIEKSDFVSGRFINTLHVTANQKADGSGSTYQDSVNMVVCVASGPQYYQWSEHSLNVTIEKFTADVNTLLTNGSALLEQIAPATSLGTVTDFLLCDMKGNLIHSSFVTVSEQGLSINYTKPGTYVFYVKATQSDNSTAIIPVQVYVVDVTDSVFVLDYGLKVNLGEWLTANDTLSVAGKSTSYSIEAMSVTAPTYENNAISFSNAGLSVRGTYGNFIFADGSLEYHPDSFLEGTDSIYVAVRVSEGTAGDTIGTVNINNEVEMYKKITILPANVVYYEDDFAKISYNKSFTKDGNGCKDIFQSADQKGQYGYDGAYGSGINYSGDSAHKIPILDTDTAVEFTFVGTGFELISRCTNTDKCVMYVDVLDADQAFVKRIPVILEYDNKNVTTDEGIYQVPVVRVDDLPHGKYSVQIRGIPIYDQTESGDYVVNTTNPPIMYVDGLRIYNPLSLTDPNRDAYTDGEDTAEFLEIRDLILEGKSAVVTYNQNDYSITTGSSIFTENRNGVLYPVNTFTITSVAYDRFFADIPVIQGNQDLMLGLRTEQTKTGNHHYKFTLAKTENDTDYYYIHANVNGTERYLKIGEDSNVILTTSLSLEDDSVLWQIHYLDVARDIVTICNKSDGSYLSATSVNEATGIGYIQTFKVDTVTDAQKWELGSVPTTSSFVGNTVDSVNDYLVFGPNNELYLGGDESAQALVFYFTPDADPATTSMIHVGVHVINDNRLFGLDGDLSNPGKLHQSAYTNIPGYSVLDDQIITSTERYYPIDLSGCKYDEANNRYEVVLYCKGGYLSFTNLKISGGTVSAVNGQVADLRYNNGVLELLGPVGESDTMAWTAVPDPENYVDFASVYKQMRATVKYEPDMDTGELVPVLPEHQDDIKLVGRSLLFKDIIKMRFYFDLTATGVSTTTPDNSGLLIWTEEEYAALDQFTVDTAGEQVRGLTGSVNGHFGDTLGIPAKNMVDQLYVRAYVILPDGSYAYSQVTQFSPVMYAQIILEKVNSSESMKELVVALMNYGAAAQEYFDYKTDNLMNSWLTEAQRNYAWSEDTIQALPTDTSKYLFTANDQIQWRGSSVTFVGAVNQNFYFRIPEELTKDALNVELLYWTEEDYAVLSELTVHNARKVAFSLTEGRAVIEGTAAKSLGNAFYFAVHIVYEEGETFSTIYVDSAHDYARRVLSSNATSDEMKELAKALVYYSCKAKNQLGG